MRLYEIDHVVLNVADTERSLAWYTDLLGLTAERVPEWRAGDVPFPSVRVNDHFVIDLFQCERTGENMNHLCLVVDQAGVAAILVDDRFEVLRGPLEVWGAQGVGESVYVADPDGNTVELRWYP